MKYFNKKVRYGGFTFDSTKERDRYILLSNMEKKGIIRDLTLQKEFELLPKQTRIEIEHKKTKDVQKEVFDEHPVKYHCDFYYFEVKSQKYVIEEIKSKITEQVRDYPLRRKLVKFKVRQMNREAGYDKYVFREIIMN